MAAGKPYPMVPAPPEDNQVHADLRFLEASQLQIDAFFRPGGVVQDFCAQDDGAGCTPE